MGAVKSGSGRSSQRLDRGGMTADHLHVLSLKARGVLAVARRPALSLRCRQDEAIPRTINIVLDWPALLTRRADARDERMRFEQPRYLLRK